MISRAASRTSSERPSSTSPRPSISAFSFSRVRSDAGILSIGVLLRQTPERQLGRRGFRHQATVHPDPFSSKFRTSPTLAASLLAEMPQPGVLRRSGEMVAYAGLNPSHHRSGVSIDRPTRISKIGNATLRSSLYMPALSAMRFNPAIAALVERLKTAGRLKPKQ